MRRFRFAFANFWRVMDADFLESRRHENSARFGLFLLLFSISTAVARRISPEDMMLTDEVLMGVYLVGMAGFAMMLTAVIVRIMTATD